MRNCILKPRLRDTTCCQTGLTTGCIVYTAGCQTGCTTRFDKRLNEQWLFVQHGCQTGLYSRFDNRVEQTVCSFNTVVKPCLSNRLYNPVWQPVERTVLFLQHGCTTGLTTVLNEQSVRSRRLSNRLSNPFDNWLDVQGRSYIWGNRGGRLGCFQDCCLSQGNITSTILANVSEFTFACYRPSVCPSSQLSVVCNIRAPYSGGSNFRQCFYGIG